MSVSFENHDHARCVEDALIHAHRVCTQQKARLTPLREHVLSIVWQSHRPVGAYGVLDKLSQEHKAARAPTVYRALEFLLDLGLVHRIESLNAYIGCSHSGDVHDCQFLICRVCGNVQELADTRLLQKMDHISGELGFHVERRMVEVSGICIDCHPEN